LIYFQAIYISFDISITVGGDIISVQNGNWSNPATWNVNAVPNLGDIATILNGNIVTVDVTNAVCSNLNIGSTNSGTITMTNGGTLICAGIVLETSTKTFTPGALLYLIV
jgi:hypothetical protein